MLGVSVYMSVGGSGAQKGKSVSVSEGLCALSVNVAVFVCVGGPTAYASVYVQHAQKLETGLNSPGKSEQNDPRTMKIRKLPERMGREKDIELIF